MGNNELEQNKVTMMYGEIRLAEAENLRTGKKDRDEMIKEIVRIMQKHLKEEKR